MIDIQVYVVHPEILKARIDHVLDVLLPADALFDLLLRSRKELGGHHHVLPLRKVPQGPAQKLLAGAALIGYGRIKEVDARFQPPLDDLSGVLLVDGPAVLAASGVTKSHAAHADAGHVQVRISKLRILHSFASVHSFPSRRIRQP